MLRDPNNNDNQVLYLKKCNLYLVQACDNKKILGMTNTYPKNLKCETFVHKLPLQACLQLGFWGYIAELYQQPSSLSKITFWLYS